MTQLIPQPLQLSFLDFEALPSLDIGALLLAPTSPLDFRITDAHQVGVGSLREKLRANLAAIRALQTLEQAQRPATPDEQAALVRYTGWGAAAMLFQPHPPQEFEPAATELRALLTEDEYASARATTPNAHYTSPDVIRGIWHALARMGFTPGGQILEPAAGIGHFFGLMPEVLLPGTRRTAVEIDSLSARIARALYPASVIYHNPFEEIALPTDFFDATIGNVPFGNYGVYDPAYRRQPQLTRCIHDYFFAKSVAKTRPGGLLALITSRYTMDKQDATVRRHLADSTDLLGAIRLPNTTFQANAGTTVTADILFLRKRESTARPEGHAWQDLRAIETPDGPASINEYFAARPQMMLGEPRLTHSQYGPEFAVTGNFDFADLKRAVDRLPSDVYRPRLTGTAPICIPTRCDAVKQGAYVEHQGRIFVRHADTFEPAQLAPTTAARIRGLMPLRDAVRHVLHTQLADLAEPLILAARHKLNTLYDSFVSAHGPVSTRENIRAYAGDPDQPLLLSLELYDPATKTATKAAVFDRRTIERYHPAERADSAAAALLIALNETARVDWDRIEQLTATTRAAAKEELDTLVYRNPEGGQWETSDAYLSGDVRAKLAAARAAACIDTTYARNVQALEVVQPADLEPADIEARLGSTWIASQDVRAFIATLLNVPEEHVNVHHAPTIATWTADLTDYRANASVSNTTTYGTARFTATTLIDQGLNGRTPTAYDEHKDGSRTINQPETLAAREKLHQISERFRLWIWEDRERASRLARIYNDQFNNVRLRHFDGSHLTFPGMARICLRDNDLSAHQKTGVWRILQTRNTLLAHVVGSGKTWTMTAAAMELRRLGLAKKSMFVVPNHLVDQWGTEFLRLYPQANLFIAGKDHFNKGNRQRAMARIACGNYDAVIVSHHSFELLPVSDEWFAAFVAEQLGELEAAIREAKADQCDNRQIVKELEKAKKRLEAKLHKRADRAAKDRTLTFEELGVDQLFVDEADSYKNLSYITKMTRIAGLPNSDSQRAFDMYLKIAYLRKRTARGVVFATGTPISNTLAEMYTMLRYLAPELLTERNVDHFDAWAKNFAEPVTALELAPDGSGYRMHTRFAKFINLPELLTMFRSVADVQTAAMLNLPRPTLAGGRPAAIAAPATDDLKNYVATLIERAENLRTRHIDPSIDNMLNITTDGRKAALDMRLIDPATSDAPGTKVNRAVEQIFATWERTREDRLTQLFFADFSTPDPSRFNIYHDVRTKLIARGIPASEIAFIHDADTDTQKKTLFDAVNAGRIRILGGSTQKMGAGTNVQARLIALHHLDAPWRPRDIEQREGRILRQGNLNSEVAIYRYVTEGSFDAYMWQGLETKARFIAQVMSGETSVRCADDLDTCALTYAEMKAIASGNPAVIEKVKVDTEIRTLDQLRSVHQNQQYRISWQLRELPGRILQAERAVQNIAADIITRNANTSADFTMTLHNRVFAGKGARDEAATALNAAILSGRYDTTLQPSATFKGFQIVSRGSHFPEIMPDLYLQGHGRYSANFNSSTPIGTIQSLEHVLRHLDQTSDTAQRELATLTQTLEDYRAQASRPFEHEAKLAHLLARQAELDAALDLTTGDQQAAGVAPAADAAA
jgi:N12 class adenine-specific DNA methylase